jgi:carbonic anhydrase
VKRRDLLVGSIALLASAAIAGGGTAYALQGIAPKPPAPPEVAATAEAQAEAPATPITARAAEATPTAVVPTGPHWEYEGSKSGPDAWAELDPANAVCKAGGAQSPIDLVNAVRVPALPGLQLNYGDTKVKLLNNSHTFQVNVDKGSSLMLDGKRYDLVQFHFHTPSEHTIDGRSFPMELHLVHQASDKSAAVIAVMLSEGAPNMLMTRFWERLPKTEGEAETGVSIAVRDLLPHNIDDYFTYSGSLTTPPCTENVRWIVLKQSVELSKSQIAAFRAVFRVNARPTQPLGARVVLSS